MARLVLLTLLLLLWQPIICEAGIELLLHGDGTDGSTTITDESGKAVTPVANAQLDTAQKVFGTASLLCDGTGDLFSLTDNAGWNFGSGEFTIDFRVRFSAGQNFGVVPIFLGQATAAGNQRSWVFFTDGSNLIFRYSADGTNITDISRAWTPSTATWYHLAAVRTGNDLKLFVDGTQVGTSADLTGVTFFDANSTLLLCMYNNDLGGNYLNGWLDEVRISKGTAEWTTNFTPPSEAYTINAATALMFDAGEY